MQNDNNFIDAKNYLLDTRHIQQETLNSLEMLNLISYHNNHVELVMRDLDSSIMGIQERYLNHINLNGKIIKSKTKAGTKVGYFYSEINISKPIIVVEGEIDWLSLAHFPNVIGLQGIGNLRHLINELKDKGSHEIYLLVDNDQPADISIGKLLDLDIAFLGGIFDCRSLLGTHKDVNEYIASGGTFTIESIDEHKKSLKDFRLLIDRLITTNKKVDHNQFAKYLVEKLNIGSVDGNIFMYNFDGNDGIWKSLSRHQFENVIMGQLESLLGGMIPVFTNRDKNNIYDFVVVYAENQNLRERLLSQDDAEVNLQDCILDPQTLQIRQYSKGDYKFQKSVYTYKVFDSYQKPILWFKFLDEVLEGYNDKELIVNFLQEFFGSLLIANTNYQKALLSYGSGANGKGVILSVIRNMLGSNNVSSIGLHEINNSQNLYNLFGKLANIDSDMQQDVQLDSGIIKKIISGEPITAKILYKQPIDYVPFAKILIACNEQPYLKTIDNSIRRRFIYLHLKNSFYGKEDPDLIKKLSKEIEDIFVWSVHGLSRLLSRGEFDIPKELTENLDNFIKENDTVELFLDEGIVEKKEEDKMHNKDLYPLYRWFCNDCGYKPLSQRNFNKRLKDKGFEDFRDYIGRGFLGLRKNQPF